RSMCKSVATARRYAMHLIAAETRLSAPRTLATPHTTPRDLPTHLRCRLDARRLGMRRVARGIALATRRFADVGVSDLPLHPAGLRQPLSVRPLPGAGSRPHVRREDPGLRADGDGRGAALQRGAVDLRPHQEPGPARLPGGEPARHR